MSQPISSYPESFRKEVVERRLQGKAGGLGYLSALDYHPALRRKDLKKSKADKEE